MYRSVMRTCEPMLSFIPFGLTCDQALFSFIGRPFPRGRCSERRHKKTEERWTIGPDRRLIWLEFLFKSQHLHEPITRSLQLPLPGFRP